MGKIICLSNQKGGVAKTFSTWAISNELTRRGFKVLVVDGDGQNTLSHDFDIYIENNEKSFAALIDAEIAGNEYSVKNAIITSKAGVDVLPASVNQIAMGDSVLHLNNAIDGTFAVKTILGQVKDHYDYIFVDCPPTLDRLTINIMTAADEIIIPVNATMESSEGLEQLTSTINLVQKKLNGNLVVNGIFFTMLASKRENLRRIFVSQIIEVYSKYYYLYNTDIPRTSKAVEAVAQRIPLQEYCKNCTTTIAYSDFVDEFLEREANNGK